MQINTRLFEGHYLPLIVYNRQAVLNRVFCFTTIDQCNFEIVETNFDFPNYVSSYFRVYNERLGYLIKNLSMTQTVNDLILNASVKDMSFDNNGNYYYEIGYVQSGGYEIALRFGILTVI